LLELNIKLIESDLCWSSRILKRKEFFDFLNVELLELNIKLTESVSAGVRENETKKKKNSLIFWMLKYWNSTLNSQSRFLLEFENMKKKYIHQFFKCWIVETQHWTHRVEFSLELENIKKKYECASQVLSLWMVVGQVLGFDFFDFLNVEFTGWVSYWNSTSN